MSLGETGAPTADILHLDHLLALSEVKIMLP